VHLSGQISTARALDAVIWKLIGSAAAGSEMGASMRQIMRKHGLYLSRAGKGKTRESKDLESNLIAGQNFILMVEVL
jgi:hypothetical protein